MYPNYFFKRIDNDKYDIIEFCRKIVQIPSENPPGDTREIVHFLSSFFINKGIPFKVYAPQDRMPNIVSNIKGRKKGRRLILNGHLDTYPVGDIESWTKNPFGGDIVGDKIYGRGVSDMKAGVTAIIMAFLYLFENREQFDGEVTLTLVSDEETGGKWGICWLLDNVPEVKGDAVINGEPSGGDLINFAEKGQIWMEVISLGKGAHGAYTHLGINAIMNLYNFLTDLKLLEKIKPIPNEISKIIEQGRDVVDEVKGLGATDILGKITVNVGTISGGLKLNLVPDFCKAEVDIRLPQGISTSKVISEIEKIKYQHKSIEYKIIHVKEPNYTDPNHEILKFTLKNAELVRGKRIFLSSGIGATDCRHFRLKGIPCSVYGPRAYQMGGTDEFVTLRDLIDTVKVHTLTAFEYLGGLEKN